MKRHKPDVSRRQFIGSVTAAGAAAVVAGLGTRLGAQAPASGAQTHTTPRAPDGALLRAGLIGCGGRGCGAAANFLDAGFQPPDCRARRRVRGSPKRRARGLMKERGQDIPESKCFTGFDGYQKLLDSGVDVVLHATPPHFRPMHMAAVVDARKHLFMEKPVAVDVPGATAVMQTAEKASSLGLSIMTGTQLRRELPRMEVHKRIRDGAIGDIRSMRAIRNQGALWYRVRQTGWSDMEGMIRDWVNWAWASGDNIVEQHIHHLDAMLWVYGKPPLSAVGMGARVRRKTGDQGPTSSTSNTSSTTMSTFTARFAS